jgi:hypothetical protein
VRVWNNIAVVQTQPDPVEALKHVFIGVKLVALFLGHLEQQKSFVVHSGSIVLRCCLIVVNQGCLVVLLAVADTVLEAERQIVEGSWALARLGCSSEVVHGFDLLLLNVETVSAHKIES